MERTTLVEILDEEPMKVKVAASPAGTTMPGVVKLPAAVVVALVLRGEPFNKIEIFSLPAKPVPLKLTCVPGITYQTDGVTKGENGARVISTLVSAPLLCPVKVILSGLAWTNGIVTEAKGVVPLLPA